ncbi:MAG: hypothetical protein IJB98_01445, partial [Clostridia bacterium]|nr:hypothetical protein [Clostridia bacterium]
MKRNIKNIICSLVLAIAMIISSNFSLAVCAVNGIKNLSYAAYEPKNLVEPYEFTSATGWSDYHSDNQALITAFDKSSKSVNLLELTTGNYPTTKYDGTPTSIPDGETSTSEIDDFAMRIDANEAPVFAEVVKQENGKTVYVKDTDGVTDKIFTEKEPGVADNLYEAVEGGYKKKQVETVKTIFYYKNTSSLSLSANSWYVITAWVWTKGTDATIVVSGTNFSAKAKVEDTNGAWEQQYIFLETSSDSSNSVNISIYYGNEESLVKTPVSGQLTTGTIFVDNVCVKTINETDYNNKTIGGQANNEASITSYSVRYDYDEEIEDINGNFEEAFDFYSVMYGETNASGDSIYEPDYDHNDYYQYYINQYAKGSTTDKLTEKELANLHKAYKDGLLTYEIKSETEEFKTTEVVKDEDGNPVIGGDDAPLTEVVMGPSTFNKNNKVLKLVNKSEKYALGLLSAPIEIEQFGYYRFSIYVKGADASSNTTIKLISYIKTGDDSKEGAIQVKEQSMAAYTTNSDRTNNWAEISFYIQANCYYDTTF